MGNQYLRDGESTIKEAIEKLFNTYKIKGKVQEAQLVNNWEKIVGKIISKHTKSIYIKHSKLYVMIDSAVVKQELSYARSSIKEKVNEELGENLIEEVILL